MTIEVSATLTALEAAGLDVPVNFADGHAKLTPIPGLLCPSDIQAMATTPQSEIERVFLERFSDVTGDHYMRASSVLFPSASNAIDAVSKFLQRVGRHHVAVLEPAFDNIVLLLRSAGCRPSPVPEDFPALLEATRTHHALFLTLPNNPTGWCPSADDFRRLADAARQHDCLLIVDRTFRFFAEQDCCSAVLQACGASWITIDDTGKTWTTLECKVSVVTSNRIEILNAIGEVAQEITLNVSPINLLLVARAMELEHGATRIRNVVQENRAILRNALGTLIPDVKFASDFMGVELIYIPDLMPSATEIVDYLLPLGIAVLPGRHFYWAHPEHGRNFIRVALARDSRRFATGVDRLTNCLKPLLAC